MSKATVLNKTAKAGEFVWDPEHDQTFSGPGQTVRQPPQNFNKWAGHYFSMDASGQGLALEVTDGSYNFWSMAGQEFPPPTASTDISIKRGEFFFDSNGTLQLGYEIPSTPTRLTVENDARFIIAGELKLIALQSVSINANKESFFAIDCEQIDFSEAGDGARSVYITTADTARISITASSTFNISKATVTVSSTSNTDASGNIEYALKLQSEGDSSVLTLAKSAVNFNLTSRGLLRCPTLALNATIVQTINGAVCFHQFDDISPTNGAQFALNHKAQMQFDPYTNDGTRYPFLFVGRSYPPGLFAFNGASSGTNVSSAFVIRTTPDLEATKSAILQQQLVAIDGVNQSTDKQLSFTYDAGYLTIKLKK
jgi:hypothetical protein